MLSEYTLERTINEDGTISSLMKIGKVFFRVNSLFSCEKELQDILFEMNKDCLNLSAFEKKTNDIQEDLSYNIIGKQKSHIDVQF